MFAMFAPYYKTGEMWVFQIEDGVYKVNLYLTPQGLQA